MDDAIAVVPRRLWSLSRDCPKRWRRSASRRCSASSAGSAPWRTLAMVEHPFAPMKGRPKTSHCCA